MLNRYNKMFFVFVLPLLLTSCWDYKDVNKKTITYSSGVDYIDENIEFVGEVAKLQPSTSENKGMNQILNVYIYDAMGKTFEIARSDFNTKNPAPNFPGTIRVIALGKSFAEKGIEPYINRTYFMPEFRSSVLIVICKEATKALFTNKVESDISVGYAIENTIRYLEESGTTLYKTIQEIQADLQFADIGYLIPYVTNENHAIHYLGLVAMKESKLVGIIEADESKGFMYILSKKAIGQSAIPNPRDEKNLLSIKTTLRKRSIKTSYENGTVTISMDLKFDAQLDYEYKIELFTKEDMKQVEQKISNKIKADIISAVKRSQSEFKSDVFGFARYFRGQNPREYKKIQWTEEYPKAMIHVDVNTTLKNTDLLNPNAPKTK